MCAPHVRPGAHTRKPPKIRARTLLCYKPRFIALRKTGRAILGRFVSSSQDPHACRLVVLQGFGRLRPARVAGDWSTGDAADRAGVVGQTSVCAVPPPRRRDRDGVQPRRGLDTAPVAGGGVVCGGGERGSSRVAAGAGRASASAVSGSSGRAESVRWGRGGPAGAAVEGSRVLGVCGVAWGLWQGRRRRRRGGPGRSSCRRARPGSAGRRWFCLRSGGSARPGRPRSRRGCGRCGPGGRPG